jgi:hypothetical protein
MTTQEDHEDHDPIRSLPIHVLERNVNEFDQTADDDGSLKSLTGLPTHGVEQHSPILLESNAMAFSIPADEWRDEKSVVEAAYKSEIHTKSRGDEEEEEFKGDGISEEGDIDALIANELNKMTLKEREEIMYDLHGVSEVIDEDPDMVARKFEEVKSILAEKQTNKKAAAYNLAVSMSSNYVKNRKFLLMFLRAERFHAKKAALRVISHFHKKLELFGASKLCKDITLEDLDPHAMEVLENGHLTLLPARDRADRLVYCIAGAHERYREPIDQVRLTCLLLHSL